MSEHLEHPVVDPSKDRIHLGEAAWPVYNLAKIAGFVGIVGGVGLGFFLDPGFRRFYFAYLVSFAFFLSIALGALIFVLLQFLTKAGWSVSVRRVAEAMGATMPILFVLSAPIVLSVLINRGDLYRWAQPIPQSLQEHHVTNATTDHAAPAPGEAQLAASTSTPDGAPTTTPATTGAGADHPGGADGAGAHTAGAHGADAHAAGAHGADSNVVPPMDALTASKRAVLNRWFFTFRLLIYFAVWTAVAFFYWRRSTQQDKTGDVALTEQMQAFSAPGLIILAVTITFAAFDLLMSLDPHWFSTMFGVYYISGSLLAAFAAIILVIGLLHRLGYLRESVNVEHFHDLGKWLFAFVFFWGYIAFSQYMLLWYASIPEETAWLAKRGATTARIAENMGPLVDRGWTIVCLILLFGQLLIPFAGLMSRHVKRKTHMLMFWAAWVLVFHWVDLYWLIMPELNGYVHFGLVEILCFLGIGGIFMATYLRFLAKAALRPIHDPRLHESLAFQNI